MSLNLKMSPMDRFRPTCTSTEIPNLRHCKQPIKCYVQLQLGPAQGAGKFRFAFLLG